jgi:pimeloyl-ACP methyl ester carboxylesterase
MPRHAVALVPGFLGFDHRQGTTYFADRFIAALRAWLESLCGAPFPVIPVTTLPIGSLAKRQECLLAELRELTDRFDSPRWHLVGHSTGGLDAALLARTYRLMPGPQGSSVFSSVKLNPPQLGSVTTFATPFYGTCLALSPLARLTRRDITTQGMCDAFEAVTDSVRRDALLSRIQFVLPAFLSGHTSGFYAHLLDNELVADLRPAVTSSLIRTLNRRPDVAISSFATLAPPPGDHHEDRLFRDLWRWTQQLAEQPEVPPPPPFPAVPIENLISSTPTPPAIDARSNDGVVNTTRQVDGAFAGLVVGDHADVLGRYRRRDEFDKETIDPGLLTSGANFGDEQFFAFIRLIANIIATNARD